jgi:hypothetical protein
MSRAINRILGTGSKGLGESTKYEPFVDSGGRPQMGFVVSRGARTKDGFLYHSLDNIRFLEHEGAEFLTFTHRATAVTIQGQRLSVILRAIMRHTLMEINAPDGRDELEDGELPTIERIAITYPNELPPAAD